ncbi:Subunit 17 of Mediator complex domain containing protein [Rhypophila sp. PSN 637]
MDRSLALQPPPGPTRAPKTIAEFIRLTNATDPNRFRLLRQKKRPATDELESTAGEDADLRQDVDMADAEETDESPKTKDIVAARDELIFNIRAAHSTAAITLEFLSLLLSKENPQQAATTMSNELREMVGIGTLGATVLDSPSTMVKDRVADHKLTAIGKRLLVVNKAADSIRAVATRLQKEVALETKYWAEVMAVSEKGWSTFRLPQEPQTMGVMIGFSSAAPEFKSASIVPMRRTEDGSVRLEHGKLGGLSKRLQVSVLKNGVVVGKSSLPNALAEDAPFEDHVRDSRDTLFALELWHELNREGRTLLGRGIQLQHSAVAFLVDSTKAIELKLVSLEEGGVDSPSGPQSEDDLAETISLTLHLLLSNAHRQNEIRRVEQTIPGANRGPAPPYPLLLPVVTKAKHDEAINLCMNSLLEITRVIRAATLPSSFTMTEPPIRMPTHVLPSEALLEFMINPPEVQFDLTITPESVVRIVAKSSQKHGTRYLVSLPSVTPGIQNPLAEWFPPDSRDSAGRFSDGMYDSPEKLFWYLESAIPRALTLYYLRVGKELGPGEVIDGRKTTKWILDPSGKRIADDNTDQYGITFDFSRDDFTGACELQVTGSYVEDGKPVVKNWRWTAGSFGVGSLEEIVRSVLSNGPES